MNHLKRDMKNKMVLGVFSGLAKHYKWDMNLVRIVYVMITLFFVDFFVALLAYVIFAMIMPEDNFKNEEMDPLDPEEKTENSLKEKDTFSDNMNYKEKTLFEEKVDSEEEKIGKRVELSKRSKY